MGANVHLGVSSSRMEKFYPQKVDGFLRMAMKWNENLTLMLISNARRPKLTLSVMRVELFLWSIIRDWHLTCRCSSFRRHSDNELRC